MKMKNRIGYVVQGNSLLKIWTQERLVGRKPRGRRRIDMIDDLMERTQNWRRGLERGRNGGHGCRGQTTDDDFIYR
jgi:hypothetical protein